MSTKIILITGKMIYYIYFLMYKLRHRLRYSQSISSHPEPVHIILARRTLDKVNSAITEIKAAGHHKTDLTPLYLDVTNNATIETAASTVKDRFERLDILINNAGIAPEGRDSRVNVQLNIYGKRSTVGSLTMITDPASPYHVTTAGSNAYQASKAALNMIAMHEQIEVAGTSLKV
ncbi:hypothetical protein EDB81DRAFT_884770 [Dactylonectria macrodidyma]|uniref:Uncharacterized protein n=1 Tax=Dactylonectria macrodidyma TaxID=307937 RepID=A0A9P9J399_9HYPO|nr:hypothetical protein EDB81DRAFT_884770 [Dactylonectria macrodidyma]